MWVLAETEAPRGVIPLSRSRRQLSLAHAFSIGRFHHAHLCFFLLIDVLLWSQDNYVTNLKRAAHGWSQGKHRQTRHKEHWQPLGQDGGTWTQHVKGGVAKSRPDQLGDHHEGKQYAAPSKLRGKWDLVLGEKLAQDDVHNDEVGGAGDLFGGVGGSSTASADCAGGGGSGGSGWRVTLTDAGGGGDWSLDIECRCLGTGDGKSRGTDRGRRPSVNYREAQGRGPDDGGRESHGWIVACGTKLAEADDVRL